MHRNNRIKYVVFIFLLVFAIGLLYWLMPLFLFPKKATNRNKKPQSVLVSPIKQITWRASYHTVGSFSAIQGINITSQVTARIRKILFISGETVQAGQVLIRLEDGDLIAQLQQKKAQLDLDTLNYSRYQRLLSQKFISNEEMDEMKSKYEKSLSALKQIQEQINYYVIKAPFSGIIGLSDISEGELIQPGDIITHLRQFDPIYLNFSLPQQYISPTLIGQSMMATISIDGQHKEVSGKMISMDSQLDENSRMLRVRAIFDNKQNLIIPGMFAEITIPIGLEEKVWIVPSGAIVQTIYGNFVFKVIAIDKNQYKSIQIPIIQGAHVGSDVIIKNQLLKANDRIVSMGGFKLTNNEAIQILT